MTQKNETETDDTEINNQQQNVNGNPRQQLEQQNRHQIQQQNNEIWYSANKILKQRKVGQKKQYLIEWANRNAKPSWQNENDVSEELKRQFYIKHTRSGKRRKRPYKYFDEL